MFGGPKSSSRPPTAAGQPRSCGQVETGGVAVAGTVHGGGRRGACEPEAKLADAAATDGNEPPIRSHPCPGCGGRMIIIETFAQGCQPRYQPSTTTVAIRIVTS